MESLQTWYSGDQCLGLLFESRKTLTHCVPVKDYSEKKDSFFVFKGFQRIYGLLCWTRFTGCKSLHHLRVGDGFGRTKPSDLKVSV